VGPGVFQVAASLESPEGKNLLQNAERLLNTAKKGKRKNKILFSFLLCASRHCSARSRGFHVNVLPILGKGTFSGERDMD